MRKCRWEIFIPVLVTVGVLLTLRYGISTSSVTLIVGAAAIPLLAFLVAFALRRWVRAQIQDLREGYASLARNGVLKEMLQTHPELVRDLAALDDEHAAEVIDAVGPEEGEWLRQKIADFRSDPK